MRFKEGDIIVGTQKAHRHRLLVLRALPHGGAKVRGIGGPTHWRKREHYLTRAVLAQYVREKDL